jgi:micrococcal nuclease
MYTYSANVISIKDGDTIVVDIDLGFGILLKQQIIRLSKINAPELKSSLAGGISKDKLSSLILGKKIKLITEKDKKEKYGRWLGTIYLNESNKDLNINELLVSEGFAKNIK